MKKILYICLTIILALLCSCNIGVSSPLDSKNDIDSNSQKPPEKYNFEKGETSAELAKELKPLMSTTLARITLQSSPLKTSSSNTKNKQHSFKLIEGGYLYYSFESSVDIIDEMKTKEHVNLLVSAHIVNEDGTRNVLFDVSGDENLRADSVIYGPSVSLEKVKALSPQMTKEQVVDLLGNFHLSEYEMEGYYSLDDRRTLHIKYETDEQSDTLILSVAEIISAVGGTENLTVKSLFDGN